MPEEKLLYFEDVDLGDEISPEERDITDQDVSTFCKNVWGQTGPTRFTDLEVALQSKLKAPIVPGVMSLALMSRFLTNWSPNVSIKQLDVVFRQPVPHDKVTISGMVTDLRQEDGESLVECDVYMSNGESGRLVGGKAILALPPRPA